jgi:hypothetical protein
LCGSAGWSVQVASAPRAPFWKQVSAGKVWELSHSSAKLGSGSKLCASNARIQFACTGLTLYSSGPPPAAAEFKRWACRNTVRAMQSAEPVPTVEHVNRFTVTVGVGRPSFGGRRTVGSHRRATGCCCSLRRAVLVGRNPSRGVVSARQVGALVRQASARSSPRPAQPCVQADGPKAAAA